MPSGLPSLGSLPSFGECCYSRTTSLWFEDYPCWTPPLPTEKPWPVWANYPTLSSRYRNGSWNGMWFMWANQSTSFGGFPLVLMEKTLETLKKWSWKDGNEIHTAMFLSCGESPLPERDWADTEKQGWGWVRSERRRGILGHQSLLFKDHLELLVQHLSCNLMSSPASFQDITFCLSTLCLVLSLAPKNPD